MRILAAALGLAFLLLTIPAWAQDGGGAGSGASQSASPAFGAEGIPTFTPYYLPKDARFARNAAEPTIGIPSDTDHVFFQAAGATHRAAFDDAAMPPNVTWEDVSPLFTPINVDPMLHADPVTNRIYAGGLLGPCSVMALSDDDGETWEPSRNMCTGGQFDHQSIGSGPWSVTASDSSIRQGMYPRAVYYCAQLALTACATSVDGGRTWLPIQEVTGPCGGLHGHIAVSEATGLAAVPHSGCSGPEASTPFETGSYVGFAFTSDNGLSWDSRVMPDAPSGRGFDPDLVFSRQSGWLWLAQADTTGIHVALSKDQGDSWETLGGGMGQDASTWFNLSVTFHDPATGDPLRFGTFPDLEAGDDGRVALAFMATTDPLGEEPFSQCSEDNGEQSGPEDLNVWHYYLSQSFDAGATWTTTRIWEDPIQVGAIWDAGGDEPCRNLLDFHDMDIDSKGRMHIALADGCTEECSKKYADAKAGQGAMPVGEDSRDAWGVVLRQTTGRGLLAAHDVAGGPEQPEETPTGPGKDGKGAPAGALAPLAAALLVATILRRRR